MLIESAWFIAGLVLLVLGADSFVRGASGVGLKFGLSPFVIGMVIVGFGTSAPELSVNLTAVASGHLDIAVGNVVGSNIANIGLILALTAVIIPLTVQMRLIRVETPLLILASAAFLVMCLDGEVSRLDALLLLAGFAGLMVVVFRGAKAEPAEVVAELEGAALRDAVPLWRNLVRLALGLALLLLGSRWMIESAVSMATAWGMSELVIGLTIVAVGTSLPELASSLMAAWRKEADIAVGNVIGSCLFNLLFILGITGTLQPLPAPRSLVMLELPAMLLLAMALYPMMRGDLTISRREGALLLGAWVVFVGLQLWFALG